jgi:hypothetical protein
VKQERKENKILLVVKPDASYWPRLRLTFPKTTIPNDIEGFIKSAPAVYDESRG